MITIHIPQEKDFYLTGSPLSFTTIQMSRRFVNSFSDFGFQRFAVGPEHDSKEWNKDTDTIVYSIPTHTIHVDGIEYSSMGGRTYGNLKRFLNLNDSVHFSDVFNEDATIENGAYVTLEKKIQCCRQKEILSLPAISGNQST